MNLRDATGGWWPRAKGHTVEMLTSGWLVPVPARWRMLRAFGVDVDRTCTIYEGASGLGPNVHIGPWSFINRRLAIQGDGEVTIGEHVTIGPECLIGTATHEIGGAGRRSGPNVTRPVVIGDGCWLGARVTVLPGVTINPGCMIAAGAVVAGDCEAGGLYAGVPARLVRRLPG